MEPPEMESLVHSSVKPKDDIHEYHRNCKQYLYELRSGTGNPFKAYNKVIDSRLQLIGFNPELVLPHRNQVAIALDPDDARFLINGYCCGSVAVTDLDGDPTPKLLFCEPSEARKPIVEVDWYKKDIASFISSATDGRITLWDTSYGKPVESYEVADSSIRRRIRMHWGINSLVAVATSSDIVSLLDPLTYDATHQLQWNSKSVNIVRWHPRDEKFVFLGTTSGDGAMFDMRHTRKPFRVLPSKYPTPFIRVRFTRDGSKLVLLDKGNNFSVFRMDNGTAVTNVTRGFYEKPLNQSFELIEEGSELRVIVPYCNSRLAILPLISQNNDNDAIVDRVYDNEDDVAESTSGQQQQRSVFTKIETGFVGNVIDTQYRRDQQHIVAISTDQHCNILTPSVDVKPDAESVPRLQEDNWSSDED